MIYNQLLLHFNHDRNLYTHYNTVFIHGHEYPVSGNYELILLMRYYTLHHYYHSIATKQKGKP